MGINKIKIKKSILDAPTEKLARELLMTHYILGNIDVEDKYKLRKKIKKEWEKI